jgi:hypothetical protein
MRKLLTGSIVLGVFFLALSPYNPVLLLSREDWLPLLTITLLARYIGLCVIVGLQIKQIQHLKARLEQEVDETKSAQSETRKFQRFHETFQEKAAKAEFRRLGISTTDSEDQLIEGTTSDRLAVQTALANIPEETLDWMDAG